MGSGYFPLRPDDEDAKRLLTAASLIQAVCDEYQEYVYGGDDGQFDNAASDGGSLALLNLAAHLCREEVAHVIVRGEYPAQSGTSPEEEAR